LNGNPNRRSDLDPAHAQAHRRPDHLVGAPSGVEVMRSHSNPADQVARVRSLVQDRS